LQYVTGHGADGRLPSDLNWRSLADPCATTVIYMPVKTLAELSSRAISAGLDPQTPAIAVARATRPDEATVGASIAELPARLAAANLPGPVVVLIGRAMAEVGAFQGATADVSSESTFRISS
jgi:uroporphyrin-III C-methyltransferase / precorrin-2 dehydrogenase / sirohydrochlorin ferrochelatase